MAPIGSFEELVVDCSDPGRLAGFWAPVIGGAPTRRSDDWWYVDPPGWTRLAFQRAPEPRTVKNRLHLDVHVTDLLAATAAAEARGATRLGEVVTDARPSPSVDW